MDFHLAYTIIRDIYDPHEESENYTLTPREREEKVLGILQNLQTQTYQRGVKDGIKKSVSLLQSDLKTNYPDS